jgi:hypothetical protein
LKLQALVALGPISGRLHLLAFEMRGEVMRVISLRKANNAGRDDGVGPATAGEIEGLRRPQAFAAHLAPLKQ